MKQIIGVLIVLAFLAFTVDCLPKYHHQQAKENSTTISCLCNNHNSITVKFSAGNATIQDQTGCNCTTTVIGTPQQFSLNSSQIVTYKCNNNISVAIKVNGGGVSVSDESRNSCSVFVMGSSSSQCIGTDCVSNNFNGTFTMPPMPVMPSMLPMPEMPQMPAMPQMPWMPVMPQMPAMPQMPWMPAMPQMPAMPEF